MRRGQGSSQMSGAALSELLITKLADILRLDAARIDRDASFRELGLSSVEGVQWLRAIAAACKLSISISRLYDHPTLRAFTEYLRGELEARDGRVAGERTAEPAPSQVPSSSLDRSDHGRIA